MHSVYLNSLDIVSLSVCLLFIQQYYFGILVRLLVRLMNF